MNDREFVDRAEALPERFADRVPENDREGLYSLASGGEYEELLDLLAAALRSTQAPVTAVERDELCVLLEAVGETADGLDALNVTS